MDVFFAIVIGLTVVVPVALMFLQDQNMKRRRTLNILLGLIVLLMYAPLAVGALTNEPYFWYLYVTVPAGGVVVLVLAVLKLMHWAAFRKANNNSA